MINNIIKSISITFNILLSFTTFNNILKKDNKIYIFNSFENKSASTLSSDVLNEDEEYVVTFYFKNINSSIKKDILSTDTTDEINKKINDRKLKNKNKTQKYISECFL